MESRNTETKVGFAPFIGMIMAECAQVGLMIAGKAAMSDGMSNFIFVFYSNALASLILLPISFLVHRSEQPPFSPVVICGFFILGVFGFLAQVLGYAGIYYSSPTLGTAMLNLIPGFTFILAIVTRMEKLDWRSSITLAKSTGTLVLVAGAFIMSYYKGPPLFKTPTQENSSLQLFSQKSNWILGGLLLAADCVFASAFLIIQAPILKKFPAELFVVFFYCFFVATQSGILCLFLESDSSSWSLRSSMRLAAVLYSAVFGSAFQVGVCTWCLRRTGPVFVSMFKPFGILIAATIGIIFFGDVFYLGSLIGAVVIIAGFYSVMWGKAQEQKMGGNTGVRRLETESEKDPLLQK